MAKRKKEHALTIEFDEIENMVNEHVQLLVEVVEALPKRGKGGNVRKRVEQFIARAKVAANEFAV